MASEMIVELKSSVLKGLGDVFEEEMKKCVLKLSEKYNFNYEEAVGMLGFVKMCEKKKEKAAKTEKPEKKEKEVPLPKSAFPLPWTGKINEDWCYGVKPNHGLFSQCQNRPANGKGNGELYGKLCSTCLKQAEKNSHGKPNGGLITERSGDFKSPSGKSPVVYSVVLKKLEITKEAAIEEAAKFGMEIPEEEFEVVEKKRGRPAAEKSEEKAEETKPEKPKKRGRPKKEKRQVSVSNAEDLLKSLEEQGEAVAKNVEKTKEAKPSPQTPPTPVPEPEEEYEKETVVEEEEPGSEEEGEVGEESGSEEEVNVVPVEIDGKEYYMLEDEANQDGCEVMDESGEVVGRYKKTKKGATLAKKGKKMPKKN
jgi:uncharacterized protein (DUF4415 family)